MDRQQAHRRGVGILSGASWWNAVASHRSAESQGSFGKSAVSFWQTKMDLMNTPPISPFQQYHQDGAHRGPLGQPQAQTS
jgi:hypothetical protein